MSRGLRTNRGIIQYKGHGNEHRKRGNNPGAVHPGLKTEDGIARQGKENRALRSLCGPGRWHRWPAPHFAAWHRTSQKRQRCG